MYSSTTKYIYWLSGFPPLLVNILNKYWSTSHLYLSIPTVLLKVCVFCQCLFLGIIDRFYALIYGSIGIYNYSLRHGRQIPWSPRQEQWCHNLSLCLNVKLVTPDFPTWIHYTGYISASIFYIFYSIDLWNYPQVIIIFVIWYS